MSDSDEWTVPDCQVCGKPIKAWFRENYSSSTWESHD